MVEREIKRFRHIYLSSILGDNKFSTVACSNTLVELITGRVVSSCEMMRNKSVQPRMMAWAPSFFNVSIISFIFCLSSGVKF